LATGRKLLLADDSVTVQKVVDLTFADEGVEVVAVSDGEQALSKLETLVPDVVLADVFMPKVNGYELCKYIKGQERLRHIPVMLLVGSFEPFDEVEARRAGADDYLTKPFQSIRQLVQKVGNLIGKSEPAEEAAPELQAPTEPLPPPLAVQDETIELRTADTRPLPHAADETSFKPKADLREQSFADLAFEEEAGKSQQTSAPAAESSQPPIMPAFDSQKQRRSFEPELAETSAGTFSPRHQTSAASFAHAAAADDALLDLGDMAAPSAAVEADDFILDLRDEAAPLGDAVFATPEVHEISEEEYSAHAPSPQPGYEPSGEAYAAPPQSSEPAAPVFEPTPAQTSAPTASGNLSPADIDAIARRVVELMSTKVIEEIAWEVVPQLSEILIKRQLEEQGKMR
jgi:CheY-like chemotaxis protein